MKFKMNGHEWVIIEESREIVKQKCDLASEYIIRHQRKDGFLNLNEWQTEELLKILEVNDAKR